MHNQTHYVLMCNYKKSNKTTKKSSIYSVQICAPLEKVNKKDDKD